MLIKEIPNPACAIGAVAMKCDNHPPMVEPLPGYNFFMGLVGPPGSGKTSLLVNLIAKKGKMMNKKFDRVEIWTPSRHTLDVDIDLPEDRFHETFDPDEVQTKFDALKEKDDTFTLWIFDDMNEQIRDHEAVMLPVIQRRRHATAGRGGLSIMIVTQAYNIIPLKLRKQLDALVMFETHNLEEIRSLQKELLGMFKKDTLMELMRHCFRDKHNFLYVNFRKPSDQMFHCNFNKLQFSQMEESGL
jgi:GTPase SAR1 family protein